MTIIREKAWLQADRHADRIAQEKGLDRFFGMVLTNNRRMLNLCRKLGFTVEHLPDGSAGWNSFEIKAVYVSPNVVTQIHAGFPFVRTPLCLTRTRIFLIPASDDGLPASGAGFSFLLFCFHFLGSALLVSC